MCFIQLGKITMRPGRLWMNMRTVTGRIWYTVSNDDGHTWRLPEPLRRLEAGAAYPVEISAKLKALAAEMEAKEEGAAA